jgi:Rap/ran-GAP
MSLAELTLEPPVESPNQLFSNEPPVVDPSFFLLQFLPNPSYLFPTLDVSPHIIPGEDAANNRAISVLDRTPVTDLHKIGLIYVGLNQNSEVEILKNTHGSRLYTTFVCSLGQLFELSDAKRHIYTGGLDTSPEQYDGPSALMFMQDQRMEQIIFHVTTLMPTREEDPQCSGKKRHIGNDYVNIVWNERGAEYKHDTIPGQFNFVVIIIEPLSDSTSKDFGTAIFRVTLSCRTDLPEQLKMDSCKLVMGSSLGY